MQGRDASHIFLHILGAGAVTAIPHMRTGAQLTTLTAIPMPMSFIISSSHSICALLRLSSSAISSAACCLHSDPGTSASNKTGVGNQLGKAGS